MCSASDQARALKAFCAALHPSLQPLRCYPMLLANIIASEDLTNLVDSNIMRSFYGGNGSDSSSRSSSTPLAFRSLDMGMLSRLISDATGMTSIIPTSTTEQLLQLVAANALSLRPMSQFPCYIQSMKRSLVKNEYDTAVQELFAGMPGGVASAVRCARVLQLNSHFYAADVDRRLIDSHYSRKCGVECCGIFSLQSKINHDCSPNSQARSCSFRSACIEIIAVRPIACGDEICMSYVGPGMSVAQRAADLLSNYGFKCVCGLCALGAST
jgi:hypothetical protein